MAVRDTARGQQAADNIRAQHPDAKLMIMQCDLSSLASVHAFSEAFISLKKPCHTLMANAGVMACPFARTVDGHEMQFGTNHLGHFALVQQLLPVLKETGRKAGEPARVVVLSSASHYQSYSAKAGGPVLFDSLDSEHVYHPFLAYVSVTVTLTRFWACLLT
jgi:NAD(P)-dependent dehydrogenase (short-subunit alcohol dehydrogenase family)